MAISHPPLRRPVLGHTGAGSFKHPEGRPDSLGHAILSVVLRNGGRLEEAVHAGREAVNRDVGCVLARAALVNALLDTGAHEEAMGVIEDGLRRLPSEPRALRLAIQTMVSMGRVKEADAVLRKHHPGLAEFSAADLGFRLGELVNAAKLDARAPSEGDRRAAEIEWPWIVGLEDPIRRWLIGAHHSWSNLDKLRIALAMYTAKVAEKLIVDRILIPFREGFSNPFELVDIKYRDISGFMKGDRAPSIGGFVLFLRAANKPYKSSDSQLLSEFRTFLRRLAWPGAMHLNDRSFVQALDRLAGTRNASAHIEEPILEEVLMATSVVIKDNKPGPLFAALGVRL